MQVGMGSRPTDRCPFSALNKQRMSLQGSPVSFVFAVFFYYLFVLKISNQCLILNLSKFKLGKTLTHKEGGDMVNVPLKKKKKVQVSLPGRATPAPKYKSDEKGDVFAFKNFLSPLSKAIPTEFTSLQP